MKKLLIANRGEIAIRIAQAASSYGLATVAIHSEDDSNSLHIRHADESYELHGHGAAAYLDQSGVLSIAISCGADAIHPGYGFLSENAEFARACAGHGLTFIGPSADTLEQFGDKLAARQLARELKIPVAHGSFEPASIDQAHQFLAESNSGVMLKAVSGGGGRGMRAVHSAETLESDWQRCESEAKTAFANGELYVEELLPSARHIEVQIAGDGKHFLAIGDRDCSLQRRHQKVVEIAPAPGLPESCKEALYNYARALAAAANYRGIGTVEFLVWDNYREVAFIELNPRLQVEHTVTEEVTGLDLVALQFSLSQQLTLEESGLSNAPLQQGFAIQSRLCSETMQSDCTALSQGGTITLFEPPSGPGIRVDHYAYGGYTTNPNFDTLIAKVVTHTKQGNFQQAVTAHYRALCACKLNGIETNLDFLKSLIHNPGLAAQNFDTGFIEQNITDLLDSATHPTHFIQADADATRNRTHQRFTLTEPEGSACLASPMQGTVIAVNIQKGDAIHSGQELIVIDSMKLEHLIHAPCSGRIAELSVAVGDTVFVERPLLYYFTEESDATETRAEQQLNLDDIRPDLQAVRDLHAHTLDEKRSDKIARLRAKGKQSARENIAQLTGGGEFIEYGALAVAAQRGRRDIDDLRKNTPADGLVTGVGEVNRNLFSARESRTAILAYDYSVLAGTQGFFNHEKTDRMIEVIEQTPMPLVFFAEGGGGRPGDVDVSALNSTGLSCTSFGNLASLSGKVPMVGINAGYCFAGNAAFLGLHDVIIATPDSRLGMGGPAMIEGGGLGVVDKDDIGPSAVQVANGTIDILAANERDAVEKARQYLAYFQGALSEWSGDDQRRLRHAVPENRNRAFDMRTIIDILSDTGSVLELRPDFAPGYITSLARIEGETIAILANNNQYLSGAIDTDCARKADRFLKLCERFKIRVLYLVDCPGLMVGPEFDAQGTARAAGDFYITSAGLSVPTGAVIIRKAYGLGAMAAMGGHSRASSFCISWPTGEAGPMGIEGAIRLGYRKELEAITDPHKREKHFKAMIDQAWEHTRAINGASTVEIDAVIDPADTRKWVNTLLRS
ncbi:MAG: carboxyl transferase domain-containing protein [Pseudomonadota bacterium]